MPAVSARAPGKTILCGEHAVVYGQPAIAIPVTQVQAHAVVVANPRGSANQIRITAPDIHLDDFLENLPESHPIRQLLTNLQNSLQLPHFPAFDLRVTSTIPIAGGMGSGAAVSVAIVRAVSTFLGRPMTNEQVSSLAFEVEKSYHGTPSGIDNTVITYAHPIFFIRGQPFESLHVCQPLTFLIANSGIKSETAAVVSDVRQAWQNDPHRYEALFHAIGTLTVQVRRRLERGPTEEIGGFLTANHQLLQELGVSCTELDKLVDAALSAGAQGAKLTGAGRGGNILALVNEENIAAVSTALRNAGATNLYLTNLMPATSEVEK
ncbi:MAG: mevalonate kinase [Anaerolineales bacterium]